MIWITGKGEDPFGGHTSSLVIDGRLQACRWSVNNLVFRNPQGMPEETAQPVEPARSRCY